MSHIKTIALFPTAVGQYELLGGLTDEELAFIKKLELRNNEYNDKSKNSYLFKEPEMQRLHEFCLGYLKQYVDEVIRPKNKVEPYITQSWANFIKPLQSHHLHTHPNSFVSGVFYVSSEPEDVINFYSPLQSPALRITSSEFNLYNSPSWWLPAQSNQMYLFPSTLTHDVPVKGGEGVRISIAFNSYLKGVLGEEGDLTELYL